jgi:hypothetical protein
MPAAKRGKNANGDDLFVEQLQINSPSSSRHKWEEGRTSPEQPKIYAYQ